MHIEILGAQYQDPVAIFAIQINVFASIHVLIWTPPLEIIIW